VRSSLYVVCAQIEIISTVEDLYEFVDKDSVPSSLGGTLDFSQPAWLSFQRVCLLAFIDMSTVQCV